MSFGLHYSDTLAGRVFSQVTTPVGVALPVYTTTAICASGICALPLYNPLGSNRNVELVSVDIDATSSTAAMAYTSIFLMGIPVTGGIGGGALSAMLSTIPNNGLLGAGLGTKIMSYNGVGAVTLANAAITLAPTSTQAGPLRVLASSAGQTTGTAGGSSLTSYYFNGTVIVPPGYMVYLASTLASGGLLATGVTWKETPIVANQG